MKYILPEGRVAYFDVDDTLVEWKEFGDGPKVSIEMNGMISEKAVKIRDTYCCMVCWRLEMGRSSS